MGSNELRNYVFDHSNEIQNEEKLKNLGQSMSHVYVGKKDLTDIQEKYKELTQVDPFYDTKKRIIKIIAVEIGTLIEEGQFRNIELEFMLEYGKLCRLILANEL